MQASSIHYEDVVVHRENKFIMSTSGKVNSRTIRGMRLKEALGNPKV